MTASGTNLLSSSLSCSSSSSFWRDACRFSSASASSVFRAPRSCCAWDRRTVMSLSAVPSSPTSSPEAGARAAKVALADPPGDPRQLVNGPHHHEAHGHREHGRRRHDGEDRDHDLAIALHLDLGQHRLHRRRHAHHRAHLVVGAVASLASLLVGDGLVEDEQASRRRASRAPPACGASRRRAGTAGPSWSGRARGASSRWRRPRPSAARPPSTPRARSRDR